MNFAASNHPRNSTSANTDSKRPVKTAESSATINRFLIKYNYRSKHVLLLVHSTRRPSKHLQTQHIGRYYLPRLLDRRNITTSECRCGNVFGRICVCMSVCLYLPDTQTDTHTQMWLKYIFRTQAHLPNIQAKFLCQGHRIKSRSHQEIKPDVGSK